MNFLFSVCLDIGLVLATPIIIYQLLAFLSPLMRDTTRKFILLSSGAAGIVALGGITFGYFIGLPSALHFLLHQFTTIQVKPLITIQSYMSFVALYMFGSALMFQLPLILLIINRIKPLKPSGLFKYERYLIVFAFIAAFIMNPTPNIVDQMIVVVPIIVMYQVGIVFVWLVNRSRKPGLVDKLRAEDAQRQAERANRQLLPLVASEPLPVEVEAAEATLLENEDEVLQANVEPTPADRPRPYATASPVARRSYASLRSQLIQ